jgi:endonuclease YncB( thermonuclease family)
MRLGLFIMVWLLGLAGSLTAADKTPPWREFKGCTLVTNEFRDGDSFHVQIGATNYIFRLAYVDAPETDSRYPDRIKEQADHFGIPREQVGAAGKLAAQTTRELLAKPFAVWTRWSAAQGASAKPRYYAVITLADGTDLGEELLSRGLARAKGRLFIRPDGIKTAPYSEKLKKLEAAARRQKLGLWADDWFREKPAAQR